jgi:hypothetical protein
VCAYRFGISLGSSSFSFDAVNSLPFQARLDNDSELTKDLFERTSCVVKSVRKVLRDLYCDDLRQLPDTTSLLPLFQLLIRFPQLKEPKYAKVLQGLALRLLLSKNLSQRDILGYVREINRANNGKDCLSTLDGQVPRPDGPHQTADWLKDSNTLRDRYVLMLYWLLRKRGARDFSYSNVNERGLRLCEIQESPLYCQNGKEAELEEKVKPEKQHLLPYSRLGNLYNIEKRGRASRHEVNNIGNITFISQKLNSYDTGLGSYPIKLDLDHPGNLESHFLGAAKVKPAYDDAVQKASAYDDALQMPRNTQATPSGKNTAEVREEARKAFERFCEARRKLIEESLVEWVEKLGSLTIEDRVRPWRLVDPTLQDQVRGLDYPDDIEDAVLDLIGDDEHLRFSHTRRQADKGLVALWVKPASDPRSPGFVMRFLENRLEVEPAEGSALYHTLKELMDGRASRDGRNWVLPAREEGAASTSTILTEFAKALTHKN